MRRLCKNCREGFKPEGLEGDIIQKAIGWKGTIYRAETTDWGKSYHGYPYRGKMGRGLLEKLREMAAENDCITEFDDWTKNYIELYGK